MLLRQRTTKPQQIFNKKNTNDLKNIPDTKNELEKFDTYYDDSSDDENEAENTIAKYDITKSWKKWQSQSENKFSGRDALKNDDLLSFVAHAAGIKLLYAKEVNKNYYALKKQTLREQKEVDKPTLQLQKMIKNTVMQSLTNAFNSVDQAFKKDKQNKLSGKQKITTQLSDKIDTLLKEYLVHFVEWFKKIKYDDSEPKPAGVSRFEKAINDILLTITQTTIAECTHKTKKPFTHERAVHITQELSKAFLSELENQLPDTIESLQRPTLGKSFLLTSTNPNGFFSNLRLANRSQKRLALNLKNALFKAEAVARTWRLCKDLKDNTDVLEVQQITSNFGRKDLLENIGNYEKVYNVILQLKEYFAEHNEEVTDVTIAEWLRQIFQGLVPDFKASKTNQSVILHKLQTITYLLFGCEATRNPAMHVINQMLIDLIIGHDDWGFEEALTGKCDGAEISDEAQRMPMAPKGAVAVARKLESEYRDFMPYRYYYHGVEAREGNDALFSKEELVELEARIVREWVKLYFGKSFSLTKSEAAQWLLDTIEEHTMRWTGINNNRNTKHAIRRHN